MCRKNLMRRCTSCLKQEMSRRGRNLGVCLDDMPSLFHTLAVLITLYIQYICKRFQGYADVYYFFAVLDPKRNYLPSIRIKNAKL